MEFVVTLVFAAALFIACVVSAMFIVNSIFRLLRALLAERGGIVAEVRNRCRLMFDRGFRRRARLTSRYQAMFGRVVAAQDAPDVSVEQYQQLCELAATFVCGLDEFQIDDIVAHLNETVFQGRLSPDAQWDIRIFFWQSERQLLKEDPRLAGSHIDRISALLREKDFLIPASS